MFLYSRRVALDFCAERWLNSVGKRSKKSAYDTYARVYKNSTALFPSNIVCENITQSDADKVIENPSIRSKKSCEMLATVLKLILDHTRKNGYKVDVNRQGKTSLKHSENELRFLSADEFKRLNDTVLRDMDFEKAIVFLCMNTGLKRGELCALRRSDIDFETGKLSVTKVMQRIYSKNAANADTKTEVTVTELSKSAQRGIDLPEFVLNVLRPLYKRLQDSCFLTTGTEFFVSPKALEDWLKKISAECELQALSCTILRNTFALRCVKVGMDAVSLGKVLGITNISRVAKMYYGSANIGHDNYLEKLSAI